MLWQLLASLAMIHRQIAKYLYQFFHKSPLPPYSARMTTSHYSYEAGFSHIQRERSHKEIYQVNMVDAWVFRIQVQRFFPSPFLNCEVCTPTLELFVPVDHTIQCNGPSSIYWLNHCMCTSWRVRFAKEKMNYWSNFNFHKF